MIYKVRSTLGSFKSLDFGPGLNVLIAESVGGEEGKTRNSAGKTSLIQLFHFLLGSSSRSSTLFQDKLLVDHEFSMEFDGNGGRATVARTGVTPNEIKIVTGSDAFAVTPITDKTTGRLSFTVAQYTLALGATFFGLPVPDRAVSKETYAPSFRSLISYLIRRNSDGGFQDPEKQSNKQKQWNVQVNLSFILGLDWNISREFQLVRVREANLQKVKAAAKDGTLGNIVGTVASLRQRVATAEETARITRESIESFVVASAYNELADEAALLKSQISKLVILNVADKERLQQLRQLLEREFGGMQTDIAGFLDALGSELQGLINKRLDDVRAFHESVVANRKGGLEMEIATVEKRLEARKADLDQKDRRRAEILQYLSGKGAFSDFLDLQKELARKEATVADLQQKYENAQILEGEKTKLEMERQTLLGRLQNDIRARSAQLNPSLVAVDRLVGEFYDDRKGELLVTSTANGPTIEIRINGDGGSGISKIETFCFDLVLMRALQRQGIGPKILVHDSHLFDGVDARQVAKALEIGKREAEALGFQYIVTMNSDKWNGLPFKDRSAMERCILSQRLDDRDETGGLFGVRLDEQRTIAFEDTPEE